MHFELVDSTQLSQRTWVVDGPLMVLPCTDLTMAVRVGELAAARASAQGLVLGVHDVARQGFVAISNQVFASSRSAWFGYMAQDAMAGRDWMGLALQALHRQRGVLLGFNDGKWHGALASFGLASRAWAIGNYKPEQGGLFHAGYARHFADAELTVLALHAKGFVYEPNSVLMEVDWAKDAKAVDTHDRALYRQRAREGFAGRVHDPALLEMFA